MGKEFDRDYYIQCINASELLKDLKKFDNFDFYELGPDGKNISGG